MKIYYFPTDEEIEKKERMKKEAKKLNLMTHDEHSDAFLFEYNNRAKELLHSLALYHNRDKTESPDDMKYFEETEINSMYSKLKDSTKRSTTLGVESIKELIPEYINIHNDFITLIENIINHEEKKPNRSKIKTNEMFEKIDAWVNEEYNQAFNSYNHGGKQLVGARVKNERYNIIKEKLKELMTTNKPDLGWKSARSFVKAAEEKIIDFDRNNILSPYNIHRTLYKWVCYDMNLRSELKKHLRNTTKKI